MFRSRAVRVASFLLLLAPLGACSTSGRASSADGGRMMAGEDEPDVVHMTTKETIRGKVRNLSPMVIVEREDGKIQQISPGAVYSIEYSKESYTRLFTPMQPAPKPRETVAYGTWYARTSPNTPVDTTEVTWFHSHAFTGPESCVGTSIAESYEKIPEFPLFVSPGGKVTLDDYRKRDYHAHVFPNGAAVPADHGAGLSIAVPEKDLPTAMAFVSPCVKMESKEGTAAHASWMPSEVIYTTIKTIDQAEPTLSRQPFAGGKAVKTRMGDLWAFALCKDRATFYLYLVDDQKRSHSKIMKNIYAGFGNTLLQANVALNVEASDGTVTSRVLVLPNPDASADGDVMITLYIGPEADPTPIASVAVPPREIIVSPMQPPATKAMISVQHYGVVKQVPQSIVLAYGTGRPTSDVTMIQRDLTPEKADEQINVDLSSQPAESFPKVLWLAQRRTYTWSTGGGRLIVGPPANLPPPQKQSLTNYKWAEPISHVLPVLFRGNAPQTAPATGNAMAPLVGGMANGLIRDAMLRESGGNGYNPPLPIQSPGAGGNSGGGSSNTSIVNITVPPPGPGSVSGFSAPSGGYSSGGGYTPPTGGLNYNSGTGSAGPLLIGSGGAMQVGGSVDNAGNYYNTQGQQTYNNQQNTNAYYTNLLGGGQGGVTVDQFGNPIMNTNTRRRSSP